MKDHYHRCYSTYCCLPRPSITHCPKCFSSSHILPDSVECLKNQLEKEKERNKRLQKECDNSFAELEHIKSVLCSLAHKN